MSWSPRFSVLFHGLFARRSKLKLGLQRFFHNLGVSVPREKQTLKMPEHALPDLRQSSARGRMVLITLMVFLSMGAYANDSPGANHNDRWSMSGADKVDDRLARHPTSAGRGLVAPPNATLLPPRSSHPIQGTPRRQIFLNRTSMDSESATRIARLPPIESVSRPSLGPAS